MGDSHSLLWNRIQLYGVLVHRALYVYNWRLIMNRNNDMAGMVDG